MVFSTYKDDSGKARIQSIFNTHPKIYSGASEAIEIYEMGRYDDMAPEMFGTGNLDAAISLIEGKDAVFDKYIKSLNGAQASMDGYTKFAEKASNKLRGFGSSMLNFAKSIGASLKLLGANLLMSAIITGLIELGKYLWSLVPTLGHLEEKLEKSKEKADEEQSKLDEINEKLKTTQDRIKELEGLDSLTIVEENELNNLKQTNAELEKKLTIQREIAREAEEEKYKDAYDAVEKYTHDFKFALGYSDDILGVDGVSADEFVSEIQNQLDHELYNKLIAEEITAEEYEYKTSYFENLLRMFNEGKIAAQYIVDENTLNKIKKMQELLDGTEWTQDAAAGSIYEYVNHAWEELWGLEDKYLAEQGDFDTVWNSVFNQDRFEDATSLLKKLGDSGELTAEKIAELYQQNDDIKAFVDYLGKIGMIDMANIDTNTDGVLSVEELAAAFGGLAKQINVVTEEIDKNAYSVSGAEAQFKLLKDSVELLGDAYAEMSNDGELSVETAAKLIDKYPDLIECIEFEGDAIRINKQLLEEKINLEKQNRIASVQSSKDAAESALKEAIAKNEVAKAEFKRYQMMRNLFVLDRMTGGDSKPEAERAADEIFIAPDLMYSEIAQLENDIKKYNAQLKILNATDPFDLTKTKEKSDKTDELKKAFEAEYDVIKGEKDKLDKGLPWDRSIIADAEDYFNQLEQLNEKYFKNSSDHAEEYAKYQIEVAEGRREIAKSEVEAIKREIESLDKDGGTNSLVKKTELYVKLKQKINDMINAYRDEMAAIGLSDEEINQLDYMKELKDELWSSEDDKIDSVISEYKRWVDTQKDAIEETIKNYEHLINKQKALIDGEKKLYDTQNNIRDIRNEISKELQSNKALSEYLDEDTRKLLFNEDDYNRLSSVLNGISSEVAGINAWYNRQINSLTEDTWYLEEEITAEYERRLAVEEKKYELARNQLDLEKKKLELNNVLNERNIRILTKNANGEYEWTYVHDAEKAADIVGEISDIESKISDIKTEAAQEASIAEKETISNIYGTINGSLEQRKQDLDDSIDELETAVDQMKSPILEFTDIVEAAAKTMNATIAKYFGGSAINIVTSTQTGNTSSSSSSSSSIKSETTNAGGDKADRSANMMIDGVKLMNINSAKMVGASDEEIKTLKSMNESIGIDIMKHNSSQWESANTEARKTLESANQIIGEKLGLTYDAASGTWYKDKEKTVRAYADGALLASKGLSLVNDGDGLEMLRTKSGSLVDLKGGETIFNAKQTEFLYKLSKLGALPSYKDSTTQTNYEFNGDIVLKDVQNPDAFINALSKRLKQSSFKNK